MMNLFNKIISGFKRQKNQPILIFISFTDIPILAMLAHRLVSNKKENVLFIMRNHDEYLLNRIRFFFPNFIKYIVIDDEKKLSPQTIKISNLFLYKIKRKYKQYDFDLASFKAHYLIQQNEYELAKKIIKKYQPKLLIVAEDGISANHYLIKAALNTKVKVLDIPYGYGSHLDLENALEQKKSQSDFYSADEGLGKAVKKYFPQWVKNGKFAGALLFNPYYIIALEESKISVKNPWTVHGGYANKIAVESNAMFNHYIEEGLPEKKLVLTGTLYCDYLKAAMDSDNVYKHAFLSAEKIQKNNTSLLICWPPSYHNERGHLCEYDSYEELTKAVLEQLSKINNVIITLNLHPAVQPQFIAMIRDMRINISKDYIIDELPKHDIYISCYSSTIRWAIAAGKPVVNYDFYQFNIEEYKKVPGVLTVKNIDDFCATVNQLVADDEYYKQIASMQKAHASDWGVMDGLNFERIYALINKLT